MSDQPSRITKQQLYDEPVVCVHTMGIVLVLSEKQYDQAIKRGKLWRRAQTYAARATREARRAEAQALRLPWTAP